MSRDSKARSQHKEINKAAKDGSSRKSRPQSRLADVPILTYGADSNFLEFKRKFIIKATVEFKDLGRTFELDEYYVPPAIFIDEEALTEEADPRGFNRKVIETEVVDRTRLIGTMKNNRGALYALLKGQLSPEGEDAIKLRPGFDEMDAAKDPLTLWREIVATHSIGESRAGPIFSKRETRDAYNKISQHSYESIVGFKERFAATLDAYEATDNAEMEPEDIAMDFLEALDPVRYGGYQTAIVNNAAQGIKEPPATWELVYQGATKHAQEPERRNKGGNTIYAAAAKKQTGRPRKAAAAPKEKAESEDRECWGCGEIGHILPQCPHKDSDPTPPAKPTKKKEPKKSSGAYMVKASTAVEREAGRRGRVLLDNQGAVSVFFNTDLLTNLRRGPELSIVGIDGEAITSCAVGHLNNFFDVPVNTRAAKNILSLREVEKLYRVTYVQGVEFTVHGKDRRYHFIVDDDNHYSCDFGSLCDSDDSSDEPPPLVSDDSSDDEEDDSEEYSSLAADKTVLAYSKRELAEAAAAGELLANSSHMTERELGQLVESGAAFDQCPITKEHVKRLFDITGGDVAAIRGRTTRQKQKPSAVRVPSAEREPQNFYSDVLFIRNQPYLVSTVVPLDMTIVSDLPNQSERSFHEAISGQFDAIRSRGFIVSSLHVDPQLGLANLKGKLGNVAVEVCGAGDHVDRAEVKNKLIKERYRSCFSDLSYGLPATLVKDLVFYTVKRINLQPGQHSEGVSPIVKFTGRKINFDKEMTMKFGDYAEVRNPAAQSNDAEALRTESAIALWPTGNLQGSWRFFNLTTCRYITRSQWKKLPTTQLIVDRMNQICDEELNGSLKKIRSEMDEQPPCTEVAPVAPAPENIHEPMQDQGVDQAEQLSTDQKTVLAASAAREVGSRPTCVRNIFHIGYKRAIKEHGSAAKQAIVSELKQLLNKRVFHGVKIPRGSGAKILRSSMFLKVKLKPNGEFDKLKARLVADGSMQDKNMYEDVSSPTISTTSLFVLAALAARDKQCTATFDIASAYLNADMSGPSVFMRFDPEIATILTQLQSKLEEFLTDSGCLIVQLDKALYGCVQSAGLWYEKVKSEFESLGYVANPLDPCVFNLVSGDTRTTVGIHVDDIFASSNSEAALDELAAALTDKFSKIQEHRGKKHNYLGMHFEFCEDSVYITMNGNIEDVLQEYNVVGTATSPASHFVFDISDSIPLAEERRARFHKFVAKLLYLSKRVRPDISVAVSFLCTRVTKATEEDERKLDRVMKYINGTKTMGMCLGCSEPLQVIAYIDASYGVHADGKSHSGLVITLGRGPVICRSAKQKIVTKSSTESELVAVSDEINMAVWVRDFLIHQGREIGPVILYQDNMSTIALIQNGASTSHRTKHIKIRYFFVHERIMSGEIIVEHMPTERMLADVLTKALQAGLFKRLSRALLNWLDSIRSGGCVGVYQAIAYAEENVDRNIVE